MFQKYKTFKKRALILWEKQKIDISNLEVQILLKCNSIIVKLYKVPAGYTCNRNITGEDIKGNLIWQVEDINPLIDSPFTNIKVYDGNWIIAYNWSGINYYINIETGICEVIKSRPWWL